MKPDTTNERPSHQVFLMGYAVGSTLGATSLGLVLSWQGAVFHSVNAAVGGALLIGLLCALTTDVCSRSGRNSPGQTARWVFLGSVGFLIFEELPRALAGQFLSGKVMVSTLALGMTLMVCSSLSVWLVARQSKGTAV